MVPKFLVVINFPELTRAHSRFRVSLTTFCCSISIDNYPMERAKRALTRAQPPPGTNPAHRLRQTLITLCYALPSGFATNVHMRAN